jgi:CBS domain-containing protein
VKVRDVMTTDIGTVEPGSRIDAAIAMMTERRVTGIPVVDEAGALVGILTEGDLLRRVETGTGGRRSPLLLELLMGTGREAVDYVRTHSRRVSDLMTAAVVTVAEDDPLSEVVRLMERRRIRRVPVVRDGRLVGIVSRFDLVAALARKLAAFPPPPATDAEIAATAEHELQTAHWLGKSSIGVRVEDGVATLAGIIHDERMRGAIRVAVQNVPGVTAIRDEIVFIEPISGAIIPD